MGNSSTKYGIAADVRRKIELLMSGDVPAIDYAFDAAVASASAAAAKSTPAPTIEIK